MLLMAPGAVRAEDGAASRGAPKEAERRSAALLDCRDDPECRRLLQGGLSLSHSQQLHAALESYEKAYALRPSPWLLVNIGRVQQKLGRPADAIASYQRYLAARASGSEEATRLAHVYLKQAELDLATQPRSERERRSAKPVYKKWWFWTSVIGAVAVVGGVTAGAVVGARAQIPVDRQPSRNHIEF